MLATRMRSLMGKCRTQHPCDNPEYQQHGGQHQSDVAAGLRLRFGRRLGDAKGVNEGIDQEAKGIHVS